VQRLDLTQVFRPHQIHIYWKQEVQRRCVEAKSNKQWPKKTKLEKILVTESADIDKETAKLEKHRRVMTDMILCDCTDRLLNVVVLFG
jgi:hypothetical protein